MILLLQLLLLGFLFSKFTLSRLEHLLSLLQFLNGRLLLRRQFRCTLPGYGPFISFLLRVPNYRVLIQSGLRFGYRLWLRGGGLLLVSGILPWVLTGLLLIIALLLRLLPIGLLLVSCC